MKIKLKLNMLMLSLGMLLFMSLNTSSANSETLNAPIEEPCTEETAEDLRCVIRDKNGNKLGACWFCDCAELAKWLT